VRASTGTLPTLRRRTCSLAMDRTADSVDLRDPRSFCIWVRTLGILCRRNAESPARLDGGAQRAVDAVEAAARGKAWSLEE
jgi:hypothetical protein